MSPIKTSDDDNVIKMPDLEYVPDSRGIGYSFFDSMTKNREKIAQIDAKTGRTQKYQELLQLSIRTAIKLQKLGVTKNDVISVCSLNRLESSIPFVSAMFLGVKFSALDPRLSAVYAKNLIDQVHPKIIFADENGLKLLEQCGGEYKIVTFGDVDDKKNRGHMNFGEFITFKDGENDFEPVKIGSVMDTAVLFFTSGTTGTPKGIPLNHYSLLFKAWIFANRFGSNLDRTLSSSTLYWISGANCLTGLINTGNCKVVTEKFDPKETWTLIDKYKITQLFTSSIEAMQLYKAGLPKNVDVSSLKKYVFVGSTISKEAVTSLRSFYPKAHVDQSYGQTEVAGGITCFDSKNPEDLEMSVQKPLSCGRPIPGYWYKIVDLETGRTLGPNQEGELRLKSKCCFSGYLNAKNDDTFDEEGWLKTGDLVYYDQDLCFYVVDRLKEIFHYKSWFLAPAVIEKVLTSHSDVQNALVVGYPHEEDVCHPMALVVLKNSTKSSRVSTKELLNYVDSRVEDKYRLRGGLKIVDSIPVTPTGKFNRRNILKELLASTI